MPATLRHHRTRYFIEGDVVAPVVSDVEAGEITPFLCYGYGDTDSPGEGTAYAVVSTSATPPSVAQIQAGQDSSGSAAASAGSQSTPGSTIQIPLDGLAPETSYYLYIQHQDGSGNDSDVVSSAQFATTDANPTGAATDDTTATGTIDPDFNDGVLYWVVTESATQPSIAQVQAGEDHTGSAAADADSVAVATNAVVEVNATGLAGGTQYWFHYQYEGPEGGDSPVVSSASFTTEVEDPTLSSPTLSNLSPTSVLGTVSTDEDDGTLYGVITQSSTTPTEAQIRAGQDHTGAAADAEASATVTTTGVQALTFSDLTAETEYWFHATQRDTDNNDATAVTSSSVTTPAEGGGVVARNRHSRLRRRIRKWRR